MARREVTPLRRVANLCGGLGAFMLTWATLSVVDEESFYGSWAPAYFTIGTLLVLAAIGIRFVQWRRKKQSLHVPV